MTIYFDMDGTIADFYGVSGWLDCLMKEDVTPYAIAKPLVDVQQFTEKVNALQSFGYRIGIVSWLSKNCNDSFAEEIANAKHRWLWENFPNVYFDEINIVPYGMPKRQAVEDVGYLFDDEKPNREAWGIEYAFDVQNILETLSAL